MTSCKRDSTNALDLPPPQGGKLPDEDGENKGNKPIIQPLGKFLISDRDHERHVVTNGTSETKEVEKTKTNHTNKAKTTEETFETKKKIVDYLNLQDYNKDTSKTNDEYTLGRVSKQVIVPISTQQQDHHTLIMAQSTDNLEYASKMRIWVRFIRTLPS